MLMVKSLLRAGTSIVLAIAILVVLGSGVCLGCPGSDQKTPTGCCQDSDHCKLPKRAPIHKDCSAFASDLGKVEQPSTSLLNIVVPDSTPTVVANPLVLSVRLPDQSFESYATPDLCLLNSVLTI